MMLYLQEKKTDAIGELDRDRSEIAADYRVALSMKPKPATKIAEKDIEQSIHQLGEFAAVCEISFEKQAEQAKTATRSFRLFCEKNEVDEVTDLPNLPPAIFFVCMAILIEGAIAGALYMLAGKMPSAVTAFSYGLTFASVNVGVAVWVGMFPIRYMRIKHHDQLSEPALRALGWLGFIVGMALLGLLIFVGSRVRSLGSSKEVFNFETLSVLATFSDGFTIVLLALVLLGSAVGMREGAVGFTHFVVGLTRHQRRVAELDLQGQDLADDSVDFLTDRHEQCVERFEDLCFDQDALDEFEEAARDVIDRADEFNQVDIKATQEFVSDLYRRNTKITLTPTADDTDFSAWRFDLDEMEAALESPTPQRSSEVLLAKLDAELQSAIASVRAAHLAYLNSYNALGPHQETDHG